MYTIWTDPDYDLAVIISKEILQWIEWIGCNGKVQWEVLEEEEKLNKQDSNKMKKMYSYISQDSDKKLSSKSFSIKSTKGMKKALRFQL
jgi:hypothetical protein